MMGIPRSTIIGAIICITVLICVVKCSASPEEDKPKILSVHKAKVQTISTKKEGDSKDKSSAQGDGSSKGPVTITAFTADADAESVRVNSNILQQKPKLTKRPVKVTVSVFEAGKDETPEKIIVQDSPTLATPTPIYTQHFVQAYPQPITTFQQPEQLPYAYQTNEPTLQSLEFYPQFGMKILHQQQVDPAPAVQSQQLEPLGYVNSYNDQAYPTSSPFLNNPAAQQEIHQNPEYNFAYQVHDAITGTNHGHTEIRNGGSVRGGYAVMDPDGLLRTVSYTSDPVSGFNAVVNRQPSQNHIYNYQSSAQPGTGQGYFAYL